MKTLEKIKKILEAHKKEIENKYKVDEIGIFGSYVRGEKTKNSDLDVLVAFKEPIGMFKFLELEEYLQKLLKVKIDLVSKKALKPRIGEHILQEVVMI
jgi:predicted nucleotidyltransferase